MCSHHQLLWRNPKNPSSPGYFDYDFSRHDEQDYSDYEEDYSDYEEDSKYLKDNEEEDPLLEQLQDEDQRYIDVLDGTIPYHQMTWNEQFTFLSNMKPDGMTWDHFYKENPMYTPSSHQTNKPTEPTEEDWELFAQEIDDMEQTKLDHLKKRWNRWKRIEFFEKKR